MNIVKMIADRLENKPLVSLDVKEGEFIAIMGKSGSGKTTLLNILSTIDDLTKGKLFIYGKNIYEMSETERAHFRKENIGFIFQNFNLLDTLTVKENIILPYFIHSLYQNLL